MSFKIKKLSIAFNLKLSFLRLLKTSEELIETLEENQVVLQNLITSKFIAHFLGEVSAWQKKLMMADGLTKNCFL